MEESKEALRKMGASIRPTVRVGKNGLTDPLIDEISSRLEKVGLVKVKFLRSAGPSSAWEENLEKAASGIKARIIEIKGGTVLLYRRKGRK